MSILTTSASRLLKVLARAVRQERHPRFEISKTIFADDIRTCASKDTIKKVKTSTKCKHFFLQILFLIRDFYVDYIKNFYLNNKKKNSPVLKWAKDLNRHFS